MGGWRSLQVEGPDGTPLHVVEAGPPTAPAVVLVHGISGSHLAWAPLLRSRLSDELHLVAPDLRGHGWSGKPDTGYGDEHLWAGDVHAVVRELGLGRPVLCGWSYGGLVVADHLLVHGEEGVGGVMLVGSPLLAGVPGAAELFAPEFVALRDGLVAEGAEESVAAQRRLIGLLSSLPLRPREEAELLGASTLTPPRVRAAILARRLDRTAALARTRVPVTVVHGELDRVVLPRAATHAAEVAPRAEVHHYEGVGHMPFAEDPARFAGDLRRLAAHAAR